MPYVVPDSELRFRVSRARGPGGQHVNKTSTRVEAVWDVRASPSLSDDQRHRVLDKLARRIDRRGRLRVASDEHRSQKRNRDEATARLRELVAGALRLRKPRKKTKPSRAAIERRLQEKRERALKKERRRPADDE